MPVSHDVAGEDSTKSPREPPSRYDTFFVLASLAAFLATIFVPFSGIGSFHATFAKLMAGREPPGVQFTTVGLVPLVVVVIIAVHTYLGTLQPRPWRAPLLLTGVLLAVHVATGFWSTPGAPVAYVLIMQLGVRIVVAVLLICCGVTVMRSAGRESGVWAVAGVLTIVASALYFVVLLLAVMFRFLNPLFMLPAGIVMAAAPIAVTLISSCAMAFYGVGLIRNPNPKPALQKTAGAPIISPA